MRVTKEWLCEYKNAKEVKNLIQTTFHIDLGRDRYLSVCSDKCSSMIWLCYNDPQTDCRIVDDLICLHNYDYDGELQVEWLENIVNLLKYSK